VEIIGQDPGLVISEDVPSTVDVTLRAPSSVWTTIEADRTSVRAILDLSGLSSGTHSAQMQIQVNARPVQILSVSPGDVTFTLEPFSTQTLSVDLNLTGETAIGYEAGAGVLEPVQIVVAGAQSDIQKVKRARVTVDLNGVRENIEKTVKVEVLDETDKPVNGISVSPDAVKVNIPISQQGGYRDVAVKVVVIGRVASGYHLTDITVYPPVVTVYAGDPRLVNDLPGILETQPLDLQGIKDDINTRLALNLPDGVSIVGEQTVLIQAGVSPIESSVTLAGEKVDVVGLGSGLSVQVSPSTVDVIASGPVPVLDTLTRQDVRVTVDLTGLPPGTYQIAPKVEVLIDEVLIESILPTAIEVVITPAGTPTITTTPAK
jgi:YbbR domain-containing protein